MCPGFTLTIPGMKPAQLLSTNVLSAASTRESQLRCLSGPVDPAGESSHTWKRILASLASNLLGASAFRAVGAAGEPFIILLQSTADSRGLCGQILVPCTPSPTSSRPASPLSLQGCSSTLPDEVASLLVPPHSRQAGGGWGSSQERLDEQRAERGVRPE